MHCRTDSDQSFTSAVSKMHILSFLSLIHQQKSSWVGATKEAQGTVQFRTRLNATDSSGLVADVQIVELAAL